MNYASYTPGTLSHIMGLQLNKAAGIDMTHVGYKGSTPALADVMGSHVPLMFDGMATSLPLIKSGKIKAFAVSTPGALSGAARCPDLHRARLSAARGRRLDGPVDQARRAGLLQARMREATLKVLAQPHMRERLTDIGFEVGQARDPDEIVEVTAHRLRARRRDAEVDRLQAGVGSPALQPVRRELR